MQDFPEYDGIQGMNVNIPDAARVKDLLAHLDIPKKRGQIVVTIEKSIAGVEKILTDGTVVTLFQPMAGG